MTALANHATPSAADWSRFLRPLITAVRNPPSEAEFRARIASIAFALPDIPAAWLEDTWRQREAVQRFEFWPSASEIRSLFADDLAAKRADADRRAASNGLQQIAAPAAETMTAEERAAIVAKAKAFAAEMRGASPNSRPAAKAAPIAPDLLLAHYRRLAADGNAAAATRLRALEPAE